MIASNQQKGKKKQKGLVLLALVIVIFLAISSYYFSSVSLVEIQVDKIEKTQAVLKRAKQALLNYVVVNANLAREAGKMGKLPCPDYRDTVPGTPGEQDVNCNKDYGNSIGYFPWRTLGIDITKDSSGSCLLYAVSPAYKTGPAAALNPDSYGQFRVVDNAGAIVQGTTPEDRPVAVIIAPESTLPGQTRENNPASVCGSYYSNVITDLLAAHLDNNGTTNNAAIDPDTENVIENIVQKYADSDEGNNPLNDKLITITHTEFWDAMDRTITSPAFNDRMEDLTEAIALCFAEYGKANGNHLPMPATLDVNGGEYRRSADYDDSGNFTAGFSGRLPYDVGRANAEMPSPPTFNVIYKNTFCDGLDTTDLSNINFTNDLGDDQGEYFDLLTNWKDHFFYAISKAHNPDIATVATCSSDCISVGGTEYSGIVFFSGIKLELFGVWQQRYAPPFETDDKSNVSNYLENNNDVLFPDNTGNQVYTAVNPDPTISNDFMFCISTDMLSVNKC